MNILLLLCCFLSIIVPSLSFFAKSVSSSSGPVSRQSTGSKRSLQWSAEENVDSNGLISKSEIQKPKDFLLNCREDDDLCGIVLNITEGGISFMGPTSYSHQVSIMWDGGPRRALVLVKPDDDVVPSVVEAIKKLWVRGMDVIVEKDLYDVLMVDIPKEYEMKLIEFQSQEKQGTDIIITFGGDGTLMHCSSIFQNRPIPPIMSFDFGSMGFLSPFQYENFEEDIDHMIREGCLLTLRMRLECSVERKDSSSGEYRPVGPVKNVLNEVVVDRGPAPYLSVLDITCDNRYMTTLQGDGIIVATPTGSTAYSLAAGGSMVHPSVPAILLTPICAHTLSFRPLIVSDSSILEVMVPEDCRASGWVSFDGKGREELNRGDVIHIKQSLFPMPTVNRANFTIDWFDALRSGFMFNERSLQSGKIPLK